MYKNGLSYTIITLLSLLTHISMLTIVFIKGQYDSIMSPIILSAIILGSDILYFFILKFFTFLNRALNPHYIRFLYI